MPRSDYGNLSRVCQSSIVRGTDLVQFYILLPVYNQSLLWWKSFLVSAFIYMCDLSCCNKNWKVKDFWPFIRTKEEKKAALIGNVQQVVHVELFKLLQKYCPSHNNPLYRGSTVKAGLQVTLKYPTFSYFLDLLLPIFSRKSCSNLLFDLPLLKTVNNKLNFILFSMYTELAHRFSMRLKKFITILQGNFIGQMVQRLSQRDINQPLLHLLQNAYGLACQ